MNKNAKFSVSIIIPSFNGLHLLDKHLPDVMATYKYAKNNILEIILIDDASTDKSVEFVKREYPEVRVIKHSKNKRFSAAVNTGVRMAKGNLVCLLNNDVSPHSDFLEQVIPHFNDPTVFGVSLSEKGFSWSQGLFEDGFIVHRPGKLSSKTHQTFWVSGGSGVFRREMWMKLKGMDEILFPPFYWEDVDLGYRALKRGWKLLWEPKARVVHEHESTNKLFKDKFRSRIQERNQLLFIWKNITSNNLRKKHRAGLLRRILKHPGYIRIYFLALSKYRAAKKLYKIEKKESTVSDESILTKFN